MFRRIRSIGWCVALSLALIPGCGEPEEGTIDRMPVAGESLVGIMTERELDRLATATADAIRKWPGASKATSPLRAAPPEWRNAADVPVDQPGVFIDTFTGLVNDRSGANIQFLRRPWVRANASHEEMLAASNLTSRVTLLPDRRSGSKLRLRTEFFEGNGTKTVFEFEDSFEPEPGMLAAVQRVDRKREAKLEKARVETRVKKAEAGEVRFSRDSLSEKIRVGSISKRTIANGRLEVSARITPQHDRVRAAIQLYFYDGEGYTVEVSRPLLRELRKGRTLVVTIVSQMPAERFMLWIDRY